MEDFPDTPTITAVESRDEFRVWVSFSDGVSGEFDAADYVEWTVSEDYDVRQSPPPRWQDRSFFESVCVSFSGSSLWWGQPDGLGNDIWIDGYRAYAGVLGRPPAEVSLEWWGPAPEPIKYPQATHVEARDGYRLYLEYDDGVSGEVDMSHLVDKPITACWQEPGGFDGVVLDREQNEISWNRELEFCGWHLWERITGIDLHGFSKESVEVAAAD